MFTKSDPKLTHLQDVPLFRGCDAAEIRAIGRLGDLITLAPGTALTAQGGAGGEAFVIVEGSVSVTRDGDVLATLGPGDVVGEVAVLDGGRRTATVTADTTVEVLVFDPRSFKSLLHEAPKVTRRMLAEMGRRIRGGNGSAPAANVS